jgi:hydroxymethylpyrimidine pyrophosphatase-like HAD family hydrolase
MIVTDVDGTLLGDTRECAQLLEALAGRPELILVPNSSRPLASLARSWQQLGTGSFLAQVGALGTEVQLEGATTNWGDRFDGFDRYAIDLVLAGLGFNTNGEEYQTIHKASYAIPRAQWPEAIEAVHSVVPDAQILTSGEVDFDVIPASAGKQAPLRFLEQAFHVSAARMVAAGDSMIDYDLLMSVEHRIVVANAEPELVRATGADAIHTVRSFAGGLKEGLEALGILP